MRKSYLMLANRNNNVCNDLIPAGRVLRSLDLNRRTNLGVREVPLEMVVGSVRRYHDFDLSFSPRHKHTSRRWNSIAKQIQRGANLPPVWLYKIGQAYIVEDGHHRISVARAIGRETISAQVIEIDHSTLTPDITCLRLGLRSRRSSELCRAENDG
jgi:hypothetical protein